MGQALYASEPAFRTVIDWAATLAQPLLGVDLREVLYGSDASRSEKLQDTRLAQPALFAVELATARLWQHYGIAPAAMVGHSVGELVCAVLAEVMTPEDALAFLAVEGVVFTVEGPATYEQNGSAVRGVAPAAI